MRTGLKFGKVTAIYEEVINGIKLIKGVVEMELGKTDEIILSTTSGINWVPTYGDIVHVVYDEKGNAALSGVQVNMLLDQEKNLVFQNLRGENILEFADIDGNYVGVRVDKQGFVGDKASLEAPVHASAIRCDDLRIDKALSGAGVITGGLEINVNGSIIKLAVIN